MTERASYGAYQVHPLADAFPLLAGADLDRLVVSIKDDGLIEPIMLSTDGATIIDGRNRWRACHIAAVAPRYARLGADYDEARAIAYIVAANLHRRQLTVGQRALLGVEVEKAYKAAAKARQGTRTDLDNFPTETSESPDGHESRALAGAAVGVGTTSITVARALLKGAPDLAEEVRAGTKKLGTAEKEMKKRATATRTLPYPDRSAGAMAERVERIREMAATGHTSRQMAEILGYSTGGIKQVAKRHGVAVPADAVIGKTHRVHSTRVARATVNQIVATTAGLGLIDYDDIDPAEAADWVTPLRESLTELNRFAKQIALRAKPAALEMTQ